MFVPGHFIYPNTIKSQVYGALNVENVLVFKLRAVSRISSQFFSAKRECMPRLYPTIAVIPTCDFLCIPTSKMAGIPLTGQKYGPFPGAKMDAPTFALMRGHLCPELFFAQKVAWFLQTNPNS